jgi:hypothetical protein
MIDWGLEKERRDIFEDFRRKLDFFSLAAGYSAIPGYYENQLIGTIVR